MEMKSTPKSDPESIKRLDVINNQLTSVTTRLDVVINLMFDLTTNERIDGSCNLTDRIGRLHLMGVDRKLISATVGRPSKDVSSRLREYKSRKSSKKRKRIKLAEKDQV